MPPKSLLAAAVLFVCWMLLPVSMVFLLLEDVRFPRVKAMINKVKRWLKK